MSRFWVKVSVFSCAAWCFTWLGDGIGPRAASASCGDYVHLDRTAADSQSAADATLQVSLWKEHPAKPSATHSADFPGRPCHGPQCGQNTPQSDPIPPVTATTTPPREFGVCAGHVASTTTDLFEVVGSLAPLTTGDVRFSRIERPPR